MLGRVIASSLVASRCCVASRAVVASLMSAAVVLGTLSYVAAQESKTPPEKTPPESKPVGKTPRDPQVLHKELAEKLQRIKLTGQFTVNGKDGPLTKEEYYILSAKKLDQGDLWLLSARIKYGGTDVTVPLPLEIKWAGETPVITLDKLTIPGLGTFSSRVLFHERSYAGTWSHDDVGGHLFGTIEKMKDDEK